MTTINVEVCLSEDGNICLCNIATATWMNGYTSNVFCNYSYIFLYTCMHVVAIMDDSIPIKLAMYIALL